MKTPPNATILCLSEEILRGALPFLDTSLLDFLQSTLTDPAERATGTFVSALNEVLASYTHEIPPDHAEQVVLRILGELEDEGITVTNTNSNPDAEDGADEAEDGDEEIGGCVMCHRHLPLTRHHVIPRTVHGDSKFKKLFTREEMNTVIMLCRPCHSAIHSFIDEKTMALKYNTLEKLSEHEKVQRWIPYISKQKVRLRSARLS